MPQSFFPKQFIVATLSFYKPDFPPKPHGLCLSDDLFHSFGRVVRDFDTGHPKFASLGPLSNSQGE